MPRVGGEADKLGNRYEGIWTVDSLVDVLTGAARAISIEPLDRAAGVEFVVEQNDGGKEYHSAKRQNSHNLWSLTQLTQTNERGHSILGDLIDKVTADPSHRAAFISATTANQLDSLQEAARLSPDAATFKRRLDGQSRLLSDAQTRLLPLLKDFAKMWDVLRRFRVIGFTETEMQRRVDQRICYTIYRPDGAPIDAEAVRLALGEAVQGWLGTRVTVKEVREHLVARGWHERDWQRDSTLREIVQKRNDAYAAIVEAELIHGSAITRKEATEAITLLTTGNDHVAIVGAAGMGKSCTMAQVVHGLVAQSVPHLTLRLDVQTSVLSTAGLGRELGLPMSPVVVLAGLAQGVRGVLVVDQLDALSLVSGRNQQLWAVFEELMREAEGYPQMRVLLTCREFDAENDHRLKRLLDPKNRCKRVTLTPLSLPQVEDAVRRAGVDPGKLTAHDLALLQTPQNLSLFLQGGPQEHGQVDSVQALLKRYWEYKQRRVEERIGRPPRWLDIVKTLANWLSDHQTLSAPADVLDEFGTEVAAMASEHVLVTDGKTCRFFHESVFDYVFARTYVAQGGTVAKLLQTDDQHLFRRAQVRQILTYNRDRDFTAYLADLNVLLTDAGIRPHIKKVVIDWMRNLPDPTPKEWRLVQAAGAKLPVPLWTRTVVHGSVAWFDLLLADGTWVAWLRSEDEDTAQRGIWLLGQNPIMQQRSEQVAELAEPLLDCTPRNRERLKTLLRFSEPQHSRRMLDLFLKGVCEGWLDDTTDHWWHHFHDFPTKAPAPAVELLKVVLERQFTLTPAGDPFPRGGNQRHFPPDYCPRLADAAPEAFLAEIMPLVAAEITKRPSGHNPTRDLLWEYTSMGGIHDFGESLLEGLAKAAAHLARDQPDRYRVVMAPYLAPVSHSLGYILLRGWLGNPTTLADDCVQYLAQNRSRLKLGYDLSSGGGGPDYLSLTALKKAGPHCSDGVFHSLEAAILSYRNDREKPQHSGYTQLIQLSSLPVARLGNEARRRLDELQRKFPDVKTGATSPPRKIGFERVPSPIPPAAMSKMSVADWIAAMRKYNSDRLDSRGDRLRGGMHELASALKNQVRKDRARYAKMTVELPDDINASYFDEILHGLVRDEGDEAENKEKFPPVAMDLLVPAIRRVHALPGRPCARSITHAIGGSANSNPPEELLDMLSDYAVNDPDPETEDWVPREDGSKPLWGGDPLFSGMNTGRGAAAWAIGNILFANPANWPRLEAAVRAVVKDPSLAVRSCGVRCLLAVLNVDRTQAIDLFLELVDGSEPVLGVGDVDNFIHHGIHAHYDKLRPLLLQMLVNADMDIRATAAQQIAVASLGGKAGADDLAMAMAGGVECRTTCAGVYAYNLRDKTVQETCRTKLADFFNDPELAVRKEAANCFRELNGDQLMGEAELIGVFLKSKAFEDDASMLMYSLDESTALLPDVVCGIPERLIELQLASISDPRRRHDCYRLPELVLRLYRQSNDPMIRRRCLDTVDRMLAHGIGDIDSELGKVER